MNKFFSHVVFFPFSVVLFAPGCKVEPPKPQLIQTVAVLPFDNESNDVNAADIMQRFVYLALKPSVYQVRDIKEVNSFLENVGIVDGGQLPAVDPVKLGKDLGVQALMYGYVENFGYLNIGYYVQRKVTLGLKLVDVSNGATLWENTATGVTRQVHLDEKEAKRALVKGLADQLADKLFNSPLEEEAKVATIKTLRTLPGFYFSGFAADEQTPNALKTTSKGVLKDIIKNK